MKYEFIEKKTGNVLAEGDYDSRDEALVECNIVEFNEGMPPLSVGCRKVK